MKMQEKTSLIGAINYAGLEERQEVSVEYN